MFEAKRRHGDKSTLTPEVVTFSQPTPKYEILA